VFSDEAEEKNLLTIVFVADISTAGLPALTLLDAPNLECFTPNRRVGKVETINVWDEE